jgi:hypothetical protein
MDKALSLAQADEAARKCLAGLITPMQASRLLTTGFLEPDPRNPMWSRFNGANGPLSGFYRAADEADRVYFLGEDVERWHPDVREQKRRELAEAEARMTPPVYAACKALLEYAQSVLPLQSHETELVGHWIAEGGRVRGNPACERIRWLAEHYLVQVANSRDGGGWETLF